LQSLAGHDGCFVPSSVFVGQFLALEIEIGAVVVNVEKVPGHDRKTRNAGMG
jgi:hypothetical protein